MMINSASVQMRTYNSTDLISYSVAKTTTELQSAIDSYITAGYVVYDIAGTSSNGPGFGRITATTSTSLLCLWKSTYPTGMVSLTTGQLYSTSKDIVIFGAKISTGSTAPTVTSATDWNLDAWFQTHGYTTGSTQVVTCYMESIKAHFWAKQGQQNIQGINFKNMEILTHYPYKFQPRTISNVDVSAYQPINIQYGTGGSFASVNYKNIINDVVGNKYSVDSNFYQAEGILTDDDYIYYFFGSISLLYRINKSNMSTYTSIDLGQTTAQAIIVGNYMYAGGGGGVNNLKKINLNTFSVEATLGISMNTAALVSDGTYLYVGSEASTTLRRITISDFSTIATKVIGTNCNGMTITETHLYCSYSSSATVTRVLLSDFNTTATVSITTNGGRMANDGQYVYVANVVTTTIKRITISNFTTVTNGPDMNNSGGYDLCLDGKYLYVANAYNWVSVILLSDFLTITYIPTNSATFSVTQSGDYLYIGTYLTIDRIYTVNQSISSNFVPVPTLVDNAITSTSWQYLNADISIQYQINYSLLGRTTRNFYNVTFRPDAYVPDTLKKFTANRNWLWKRSDVENILIPTTSTPKRIKALGFIETTSTASYSFTGLPSDENWILRATSTSGDIAYFQWYNEQLKNTVLSNPTPSINIPYTVTNAFQVLEFETISDLRSETPLSSNGSLSGSVLMNNLDNEFIA